MHESCGEVSIRKLRDHLPREYGLLSPLLVLVYLCRRAVDNEDKQHVYHIDSTGRNTPALLSPTSWREPPLRLQHHHQLNRQCLRHPARSCTNTNPEAFPQGVVDPHEIFVSYHVKVVEADRGALALLPIACKIFKNRFCDVACLYFQGVVVPTYLKNVQSSVVSLYLRDSNLRRAINPPPWTARD